MAVTVASGKRGTFKGTSAVDTFIINDDTKGATITNVSGGDIIAIEGFAADFTAKVSGRVVTLTSTVDTALVIKFQLAATSGTASVRFLDGDLTATYTAASKSVTLGAQKLTAKAAAVSDAALGTSDSVSTFDETAGGGSSSTGTTFTLTTGADNTLVVGGSGNDIYNGVTSDAGAATDTFNTTDVINGGTGSDTLNLIVTGTNNATTLVPAEISGIEAINVRALLGTAATVTTVTASNFTDATEFNADRATSALTVSALSQGQSVGMKGNALSTNGALTANYAAAATSNTLNISGGTTAGNVAVTGTGLLSTTINSTGGGTTGNTIGTLGIAATVTSATVNATTALTTGAVTANALTSLTVTGAGAVALGTTIPATVTTLNASAMTGALTATLANTATQVVTLGSGADVITTGGVLTTGSVNAGTGTDVLATATMAHVNTAALGAKYTGFETLRLNHATANTLDMNTTLSGITAIQLGGDATLTNLTATQAANITIRANAADGTADDMSFALAVATGTSDVVSVVAGQGTTTTSASDIAALTVTGFETLNVQALAGPTSTAGAGGANDRTTNITGTITGATLANINLTGTAVNIANVAVANATAGVTINGSALTGDGAATSIGLTVGGSAIAGSTITGSAVRDVFVIGAEGSTYTGGAGNDGITTTAAILAADGTTDGTIVGGLGTDTLTLTGALTLTDNNFTNVTGMEALASAETTAVSYTGFGAAAKAAFADGMTVTTGTLADNATYAFASGLYDKAVTLTLAAAAVGAGAGENISVTTGIAADTISIDASAGWVGAAGATSSIIVSTGAGADTISVSVGTLLANTGGQVSITGGTGVDTITKVGTNDATAAGTGWTSFNFAAGDSTTTAYDSITGFDMSDVAGAGGKVSDGLNFASVGLNAYTATAATGYAAAALTVAVSAAGVVTFAGTSAADLTLAEKIAAVKSVVVTTAGDSAFFTHATAGVTSSYVFNNNATSDSVVELVGVTGAVLLTTNDNTTNNGIFIL